MNLQLLKKVTIGIAMIINQVPSNAQDSETTLNQKYWNMRERFRKYYVSLGEGQGQGIPASKRQAGGGRCGTLQPTSFGWMSWGDATSYIGDYMCTLATEYALLNQDGKSTKATLSELYYALNAIDRLDGVAENAFDPSKPIDHNGFFYVMMQYSQLSANGIMNLMSRGFRTLYSITDVLILIILLT